LNRGGQKIQFLVTFHFINEFNCENNEAVIKAKNENQNKIIGFLADQGVPRPDKVRKAS